MPRPLRRVEIVVNVPDEMRNIIDYSKLKIKAYHKDSAREGPWIYDGDFRFNPEGTALVVLNLPAPGIYDIKLVIPPTDETEEAVMIKRNVVVKLPVKAEMAVTEV